MERNNFTVSDKIVNRLEQMLPGSIFFIQDLLDEGNAEAVRQQLTRLVKANVIKRLSHGIYLVPKKLGGHGFLLPNPDDIANAIARRDKSRIIPTGEVALWKLGLSTQVPLNYVYLTDGPSRGIKIEEKEGVTSYTITFKHASPKNFALKGKITSQVIPALKAIGQKNLTADMSEKIELLIMREDLDDLKYDMSIAPAWIAKLIKESFNSYK
jgi:hypothetical protein